MRLTIACAALALAALPIEPARAQDVPCGGSFQSFVADLKAEAVARDHAPAVVEGFFDSVRQDPATLRADRRQGIFQLGFLDFSRRVISQNRLDNGRIYGERHADILDEVRRTYGVQPGVLLAFWGLETDFGQVQGDFNTANSLVTLAHDCRRPELFRPQVFAAIELFAEGGFDPATTTGAWAGEIGMVQMLPRDILENGVDADGDGRVSLKTSVPDALMSGGAMLQDLGWRPNEPWLQEVRVPGEMDWSEAGLHVTRPAADWGALGVAPRSGAFAAPDLPASLILPQGRNGPAFLAYPNYRVFFEWNESFVYVTTAAYYATRLSGAPVYDAGNPGPALSEARMKALQERLVARGYDTGGIDGILGARTRAAVRAVQQELGLPADAWPTLELLERL
jgi:lytic murein transglycosylase